LLVKAANENGYTGKFYTYYTGVTGTPTALGKGGEGRVFQIAYSHYNMGGQMQKWMADFKKKFNDDFYTGSVIHIYTALGEAMAKAKVFNIITTISPDGRTCFGINFPFVGSLFIYETTQKTDENESTHGYHYNGLFKEWSDGDLIVSDKTAEALSSILEPFIQHNGLSNKQLSDQGLPVAKIKEIIRTHSLNTPTTIPDTELVEEDNMKSKDNLQDTPKTDKETSTEEVIVEEKEVKKFKQKVPFTANAYLRLVEVKDHVNGGVKKLVGFFTKGLEAVGDVGSDIGSGGAGDGCPGAGAASGVS
jgi:hypothetical protein